MTAPTIAPAAPPGQPDDAAAAAFAETLYGLQETVRKVAADKAALTAERDEARSARDEARKDRAAVVHQNLALQRLVGDQDDEIRELLNAGRVKDAELARHRAAAQAREAFEAVSQRPGSRTFLLAAASGAGVLAGLAVVVAGFALNSGWLIAAGAAVLAVSAGTLARICVADDPSHPFDMGPAEVGGADA